MGLHSYGTMGVDWEERVRFDRCARSAWRGSRRCSRSPSSGALLCFDMAQHPLHHRHAHRHLGAGQAQPLLPAAPGRRADHVGLRLGRAPPPALQPVASRRPLARRHLDPARRDVTGVGPRRGRRATRSASSSSSAACSESRSASTPIEPPVLFALQREGIEVVDGQQLMQQARVIKTRDEITLLNMACAMVDAAYEELYRAMRPGIRENDCVAPRQQGPLRDGLGVRRGRQRDLGRALQPASPRVHRPRAAPGRPGLLRHPPQLHGLPHVLLPHVRGGERARGRWSTPTSAAATTSTRRSS